MLSVKSIELNFLAHGETISNGATDSAAPFDIVSACGATDSAAPFDIVFPCGARIQNYSSKHHIDIRQLRLI